MRRAVRRLFVGTLLLAFTPSARAQTVAWQRFDPLVIPSSYSQSYLTQAIPSGPRPGSMRLVTANVFKSTTAM